MLSVEQLAHLRGADVGDAANKVGLAMALTGATQEQIEATTGLKQPYVSSIVNGRYSKLPLETARKIADFFGCLIEDLFPAKEAVA